MVMWRTFTLFKAEPHATQDRMIGNLAFRRTLQVPLAQPRSQEKSRESMMREACGIINRTSFAERSRSADLSAYVKACFGLCDESTDESFKPFQALALELSKNTGSRWTYQKVTRSSIDLAVKLYISVVGAERAFFRGQFNRKDFVEFVARHTGMDARTVAGAITPNYLHVISLERSHAGPATPTGISLRRRVSLNGGTIVVEAARPHAPALSQELWARVARFLSTDDIPSLSIVDATTRSVLGKTGREQRLIARAQRANQLADVQWFYDPLVASDIKARDAIRDASVIVQCELLCALARRLVSFADRQECLKAYSLITDTIRTLPPAHQHVPLQELANLFLWGKTMPERSDLGMFLSEVTGRRYVLGMPDSETSKQLFDGLLKASTEVTERSEIARLSHYFNRFEPIEWMHVDKHRLALKVIIDDVEKLPEKTRAAPLATLYAAVWRQVVVDAWRKQATHVSVEAHLSATDLEPFIDWLRNAAKSIPSAHRTPFARPASMRSQRA
jgi:hypothetical protein